MHVNGNAYFVAISKHIKHISLVPASSMNKATMLSCIDKVIKAYDHRGFTVKRMHMDNAFKWLQDDLRGGSRNIDLNIVAANEHEPNIERCIQHIKERCRCAYASIPFKRMPRRLSTELVNAMVYWINCVPRHDGVHPVMSPRMIMTGQQLTTKHTEFQFGDFIQSTQPPRATTTVNSMDERTSDSIYCFPSGNAQGGYWVYKLSTNQVVHRNTATLVHMNDAVVEQVGRIAANEDAPIGLIFGDRDGIKDATILDFEDGAEFDDDVSDGEYDDNEDQELEGDHELGAVDGEEEDSGVEDNDEDIGVEDHIENTVEEDNEAALIFC